MILLVVSEGDRLRVTPAPTDNEGNQPVCGAMIGFELSVFVRARLYRDIVSASGSDLIQAVPDFGLFFGRKHRIGTEVLPEWIEEVALTAFVPAAASIAVPDFVDHARARDDELLLGRGKLDVGRDGRRMLGPKEAPLGRGIDRRWMRPKESAEETHLGPASWSGRRPASNHHPHRT
ncbi:MAG TPA: hypothetical protein VGD81_03825 [Opitutaceae bacterium]